MCDNFGTMSYITKNFVPYTLTQLRNGEVPEDRPIHIFSEGVYDMFHYGHIRQLRQVKEAFPNVKVTVGICSDELVLKFKGGPLVMSQDERLASVAECKYVDDVIDHGMFYPTIELLDKLQADLIAHDSIPYPFSDGVDCYKPFKKSDRFLTTQRTEGISTTDLIQRILDQSEKFRERNVAREKFGFDGLMDNHIAQRVI
ncbi:cytidyltransferase domain protein [Dictyocaulus viviparus]|uniref:choline-phosphate cytidylyltransferase n=1 Tax=Dictyocaulus viviparus TaxID=29172 RepID=A0A0D8YBR0_DICVI|nr:cytidyltransferase domain protein [Dictyocaulus viviparus]